MDPRFVLRFFIVTVIVSCATLSSIEVAAQVRAPDTRTNPQPWRPVFGAVNASAASSASTPTPFNADPLQRTGATQSPSQVQAPSSQNLSGPFVTNQNSGTASARVAELDRPRSSITKVTKSLDILPNDQGQIWREYDISPYTSRVTSTEKPQQAILDWILRETGTEMWFNEPMGILNADKNHIYVYHTPEIQSVVGRIVDRFVKSKGQVQAVDINLITVENPNWRQHVYNMLQPIEVQTAGIEAWLVSKENAARLLSQLSRRGDFAQHSSGRLMAQDGQNIVLEKTRPTQFVRSIRWVGNQAPGYQPLLTQVDEGYRLSISSLTSLDERLIEATIKCDVDQIERLSTVKVDVPGVGGSIQQMDLQIPQLLSWRLHERFRWPNDQVLLLSCGVVAKPDPQAQPAGNLGRLLGGARRNRADALVFIEYRGPAESVRAQSPAVIPQPAAPSRDLEAQGFRNTFR